ncbi:MAG TPA: hypothetical protein VGJ16_11540 [Pirellulales bacterium]|jgi:hypothetical protein
MFERRDDLLTVTAIGLLGYLTADLAHHLLGHGTACLLEHGRILLLSSIVLRCSVQSVLIDLSGPIGNLVIGLLACAVALQRVRGIIKLLAALTAGFNLFWFAGQLIVSVASRSDDWAWAIADYHVSETVRILLIGIGVALYLGVVRMLAAVLEDFAVPRERLSRICRCAWLAATAVAALTALLDQNPWGALLKHALPQGVLSPLGLLLVANRAAQRQSQTPREIIARDRMWIGCGVLGTFMSLGFLGVGTALG